MNSYEEIKVAMDKVIAEYEEKLSRDNKRLELALDIIDEAGKEYGLKFLRMDREMLKK